MSAYGIWRIGLARELLSGKLSPEAMARRLETAATEYPGLADELRREAAGYRCQAVGRQA